MKKEISIERSEEQRINILYHIQGFVSIRFGSLRIMFQLKISREFRKVDGDKLKEVEQFKTKRMYFNEFFKVLIDFNISYLVAIHFVLHSFFTYLMNTYYSMFKALL